MFGPGEYRLCWLTLRDCLSFKVFFLQYTTQSSFCGKKYAESPQRGRTTREPRQWCRAGPADTARASGRSLGGWAMLGVNPRSLVIARRYTMSLRPEPQPFQGVAIFW